MIRYIAGVLRCWGLGRWGSRMFAGIILSFDCDSHGSSWLCFTELASITRLVREPIQMTAVNLPEGCLLASLSDDVLVGRYWSAKHWGATSTYALQPTPRVRAPVSRSSNNLWYYISNPVVRLTEGVFHFLIISRGCFDYDYIMVLKETPNSFICTV